MPDRSRGFTLLEVLVALAILSAVMVMGYRVMTGAIAAEQRSERWTQAAVLGEALLRETVPKFPELGETTGTFPAPNGDYSWKIAVVETLHPDAREVDVTVTYGAGTAEEEPVTLNAVAIK